MTVDNVILATYACNGASVKTDTLGMREMQRRIYAKSEAPYLLLKAPPASGKSRALMYVALEKLARKQINKVIIAVPERSIAKSFSTTNLTQTGFHSDWIINPKYDLCSPGGDSRKVSTFVNFLHSNDKVLLCTHSTLRFAYDQVGAKAFDDTLLAIDEFHHVSSNVGNKLGELLRCIMKQSNANILAMTGSYFRGDCVAVLSPEDETRFTKVTYNYYEQLNGYRYLKSLGIGFHFYHGKYIDAIPQILDIAKKTIIHIPSVNAAESTKEKLSEVDTIIDIIGEYQYADNNNIIHVNTKQGEKKIADLVTDDSNREKIVTYLRNIHDVDDIDIIIALGMAKEGFDWPYCEQTLTIGYRGSLTEIVQIIGRCTRDSANKTHAQFTNLIAEPDAAQDVVVDSVNNILKAIAASLLMEEVIAPKFTYSPKGGDDSSTDIVIDGFREPPTKRAKDIIDNDIPDLKATILQDQDIQASFTGGVDPEVINKVLIPKVIRTVYPDLSEEEVSSIGDYVKASSVITPNKTTTSGKDKFITLAGRMINVIDMNMDLINSINPFQEAFEVLSRSLDARVFKAIQQCIQSMRIEITDDEALILWPKIQDFYRNHGRVPSLDSLDPLEKRMAEALVYLRQLKIAGR